jgi:hypothetical protein
LIEAPHCASEYLDLFIRDRFASGLLVRLHDGRDSVSDIATSILVFTITHEAPAASVYHRIERVSRQFAGPQIQHRRVDVARAEESCRRTQGQASPARFPGWTRMTSPGSLSFLSPEGAILDSDNLCQRCFLRVLVKAGIRKVRFHDLRIPSAPDSSKAAPRLCT